MTAAATSATASSRTAGPRAGGGIVCYIPTRRPTAGSPAARSSRSSGPPSAMESSARPDRPPVREAGSDTWREVAEIFRSAVVRTGALRRSQRLLHRAGPRPRRGARVGFVREREMVSRWSKPGSARCASSGPGEDEPDPRSRRPPRAGLRRAYRGDLRELGYSDEEISAMVEEGPRPGRRRPRRQLPRMSAKPSVVPPGAPRAPTAARARPQGRGAADRRARRGLRRPGGDDQALPARGLLPEPVKTSPQHGLLPASYVERIA